MIAKTRHKKAKAKYNYPLVKARIKKQYRKRFKKSASLTEIDKVWKAYLEKVLIKELLSGKKVEVIRGFEFEVVGRKMDDKKHALLRRGVLICDSGKVKNGMNINMMKKGFVYSIECNNVNFKKGKLYFKADKKIRKSLNYLLSNTGQYFRIEQNESK